MAYTKKNVRTDAEMVAILLEENEQLRKEKEATDRENAAMKKVLERPDFTQVCLRNEWYILAALRNHLRHLNDALAEHEKSDAKIVALPDEDPYKARAMQIVENSRYLASEIRQHIREYSKAADDLKKVMKVSIL